MNMSEFVELSGRSENMDLEAIRSRLCDTTIRLLHGTLGVGTESGELQDALKRFLIYGKDLDKENVKEEIGDLAWYIALICRAMDFSLEEILDENIQKLAIRYPDKFSEADAIRRADKLEG